jgi:hypothetical protein
MQITMVNNRFPLPVLTENPDKSSYIEKYFINLIEIDKLVLINNNSLNFLVNISTNILDSLTIPDGSFFYMVKITSETKTFIIKNDTNVLDYVLPLDEFLDNEKIIIKAFLISKTRLIINNNGSLISKYPKDIEFEFNANYVLGETNEYNFYFQRNGGSFFKIIEKSEISEDKISFSLSNSSHVYIYLDAELNFAFSKLNSKDNSLRKFIVASILLPTLYYTFLQLTTCSEEQLSVYSGYRWYKLLSYAVENSNFDEKLEHLLKRLRSEGNIDIDYLNSAIHKILNHSFSKEIIHLIKGRKTDDDSN